MKKIISNKYKIWLSITSIVMLVSCSPSQSLMETFGKIKNIGAEENEKTSISGIIPPDYLDINAKLSFDDYKSGLHPKRQAPKSLNKNIAIDIPDIIAVPERPEIIESKKLVSLSVTEDVPIKDVLLEISRLANIDIEMESDITGGVILNVHDKPVDQVIDRIARMANLRYEVNEGVLRIEKDSPFIKNYNMSILNLTRSNNSSVSITTQVLSSGFGDGGEGLSSGSSNTITSEYDGNLWQSVETDLLALLNIQSGTTTAGEDTFISINKQAGIIVLKANSQGHDKAKKYLDSVLNSTSAQVLIEAKIIEVSLDDAYKSGIDWSLLADQIGSNGISTTFIGAIDGQTDLTTLAFSADVFGKDLTGVVSLLSEFGTSRALSSPRLLAINNQQSILTFARNHVYFTVAVEEEESDSSTSTTTTSTVSITSEAHTIPIGVILALQPSIDIENNEITMNIRPTLSRITETVADPGVTIIARNLGIPEVVSEIPVVEVRELDTVLKIANGQTMVIGGLMDERVTNNDIGVPGLSKIPVIGNAFKSVSKSTTTVETVIFIKATIVNNSTGNVGKQDKLLLEKFIQDPRPI